MADRITLTNNPSALIVRPTTAAPDLATNDIRGIKPPVEIPSGWEWLWWTLAALAVAAALLAWWKWWRRQAGAQFMEPPVPPHVRARLRLQEALRLLSDPRLFCIAVSDALRLYLEERFQLRAPERTTEEFLQDLQGTPHLNQAQKLSLADFLERCDLVKFAKFEPTEAVLMDLHESALRLVDETQYDALRPPTGSASPPTGSPAVRVANEGTLPSHSLAPRGTSGERVGERGAATGPSSSPRPSPLPASEEREKTAPVSDTACALPTALPAGSPPALPSGPEPEAAKPSPAPSGHPE